MPSLPPHLTLIQNTPDQGEFQATLPEDTGVCISHTGQESPTHSNDFIMVLGSSNMNAKAMLAFK